MTIRNIIEEKKSITIVPFTLDNYRDCLCPGCMVQLGSACVGEKRTKLGDVTTGSWNSFVSRPELLPALYCSGGKSDCEDIDTLRMCECSGCPTFIKHGLREGNPKSYFCRDGCQLFCKE